MITQSSKHLLVGFGIVFITIGALLVLSKRPQHAVASPKLAQPSAEAGANEAISSFQRELEQVLKSRDYNDLLERVRNEQITPEDFELLLKIDDLKGKMIKEPQLEKRTKYPPDDAKGLEMWRWWRSMQAADSRFTYKRPISFYGKVVDDADNPVQDVDVFASISGPNGDIGLVLKTDAKGLFQFEGLRGKFVTLDMGRPGYGRGPKSYGTFEYAEFFSERFHQADPSNPVVFVLPRLVP